MSTYLLHNDQYANGNLSINNLTTGSGSLASSTRLTDYLKTTDPREFSSTDLIIIYSSTDPGHLLPYQDINVYYKAEKETTVDYAAFNKHNFSLQVSYGGVLVQALEYVKISHVSSGVQTTLATHYPTTTENKNFVLKFNKKVLTANDFIVFTYRLNRTDFVAKGSRLLRLSYVQIGKSTELRELEAPFNIPYGKSYKTKHQRSDTGLVIATSSKVLPSKIDLKLKNQTKEFIDTNFQNIADDVSKNPFFIFDDSGNLPLVPFCWLTKKIKSPKINKNHLYDISINAQAKVYVD